MPTNWDYDVMQILFEVQRGELSIGEALDTIRSLTKGRAAPKMQKMQSYGRTMYRAKPKRKLSAWNKYIKNKRNHIKYRDGKLNLKKMGVAFRRKQRR
jgi:hypothetical protein